MGKSNMYYFHKPLFWFGLFCVFFAVVVFYLCYGLSAEYVVCNNTFCVLDDGSLVPFGYESGVKPLFVFRYFELFALFWVGFLFLVNHLIFNRRFKRVSE
jgi:hypothetical protein